MQLGEALKTIRKQKNLKQKELSDLCSITQTYLSQIENNKRKPNLELVEKFSRCLGIPLPVIMFLSLTENDVDEHKRPMFNLMTPSIQKYIKEIFI